MVSVCIHMCVCTSMHTYEVCVCTRIVCVHICRGAPGGDPWKPKQRQGLLKEAHSPLGGFLFIGVGKPGLELNTEVSPPHQMGHKVLVSLFFRDTQRRRGKWEGRGVNVNSGVWKIMICCVNPLFACEVFIWVLNYRPDEDSEADTCYACKSWFRVLRSHCWISVLVFSCTLDGENSS